MKAMQAHDGLAQLAVGTLKLAFEGILYNAHSVCSLQDDVTPAVVLTLLSDLVEVADLLGGYQIQVTLDLRRHNAQSLLHPGLGKYQGTRTPSIAAF